MVIIQGNEKVQVSCNSYQVSRILGQVSESYFNSVYKNKLCQDESIISTGLNRALTAIVAIGTNQAAAILSDTGKSLRFRLLLKTKITKYQ